MVSAKATTFFPPSIRSEAMAVLETAVRAGSMTRVVAKTALKAGSSQQGKARRASVASNCVAARVRVAPARVLVGAAVEAAQLVVERAPEDEAQAPGARRDGLGEAQATALVLVVGRGRAALRGAAVARDGDLGDRQLGRVQPDLGRRLASR